MRNNYHKENKQLLHKGMFTNYVCGPNVVYKYHVQINISEPIWQTRQEL